MSGKRKCSSPGNQGIERFFMVRQEISLPPENERSDSEQDGGTEKTESEKKTANTSSLDETESTETEGSTPLEIQIKRVSDKIETELELADATAEDEAQPQETKSNTYVREQTQLKKSQYKVRGLTASSTDKSHCQEMKSSTSTDTVVLTDPQGREELRVIFDNVDTAILYSYYLCKERNCGELQDKFRSNKSKFTYSWLYYKELSCIETCGLWSLTYKENDGMFCLLCRKHNINNLHNNSNTWNATPSTRFRRLSIVEHFATKQHKDAVQSEMSQRVSSFQKNTRKNGI